MRVLISLEQYDAIRIYRASPRMIQACFKDVFLIIKSLLSLLSIVYNMSQKKLKLILSEDTQFV